DEPPEEAAQSHEATVDRRHSLLLLSAKMISKVGNVPGRHPAHVERFLVGRREPPSKLSHVLGDGLAGVRSKVMGGGELVEERSFVRPDRDADENIIARILHALTRKTIAVIDVVTGEPRTWKHDFGASPVLVFGRDSAKLYGWSNFMKRIDKGEQKPTYEHHKTVVEWDARTGKELRTLDWKAPGGIRSEGTVPASARL